MITKRKGNTSQTISAPSELSRSSEQSDTLSSVHRKVTEVFDKVYSDNLPSGMLLAGDNDLNYAENLAHFGKYDKILNQFLRVSQANSGSEVSLVQFSFSRLLHRSNINSTSQDIAVKAHSQVP